MLKYGDSFFVYHCVIFVSSTMLYEYFQIYWLFVAKPDDLTDNCMKLYASCIYHVIDRRLLRFNNGKHSMLLCGDSHALMLQYYLHNSGICDLMELPHV